ncbi:alpha/beta hydrolase [bacterium SCSIO 12741]|nr:alpha/beta hydrolase [bacterium SCSIO 12741]
MKAVLLLGILIGSTLLASGAENDKRFVIFLHNRFLEEHNLNDLHPDFGRVEYEEILSEFRKSNLTVISEMRNENVNARLYAVGIVNKINSLLKSGVEPQNITIVGTSKGGYIAQYVSTLANNKDLNFVFIACFRSSDIQELPEINFCGNILTIYERSDSYGVSARERKETSNCEIEHFKELELNTGLGHGFLFKPLKEWIEPTIKWANGNYDLD